MNLVDLHVYYRIIKFNLLDTINLYNFQDRHKAGVTTETNDRYNERESENIQTC